MKQRATRNQQSSYCPPLDKDTSGVMLFVNTVAIHARLDNNCSLNDSETLSQPLDSRDLGKLDPVGSVLDCA